MTGELLFGLLVWVIVFAAEVSKANARGGW
jgi:hypothetical protein